MRDRILLIIAAATVIGGLFLLALWLGGSNQTPRDDKTPAPSVSVTAAPAPSLTPTATPGPENTPPATTSPNEEDEHNHGDQPPPDDCSGPVGCSEDDISRNTQSDLDAAAAVRSRVAPFVAEWAKVDSSESAATRTARLISAGATSDAASTTSVLARANTAQTGLTVSTSPRPVQRVLFMARDGDLLKFQASLDVDARYMQPDDSGSVHVAGGAVYVYLTEQGTIAKVTDRFPTIEGMR